MNLNPITACDTYKISHPEQYPEGTTFVLSNWTPRGSRIPEQKHVVTFGLQYFLKEYLGNRFHQEFFERSWESVEKRYKDRMMSHLGQNSPNTERWREIHKLGYLPLEFRALPEGTLCPLRVPMLTVENTHPSAFWLTNYVESLMSTSLWMSCTSATSAYRFRQMLDAAAKNTGGDPSFVPWQGHDFSFRGMSSLEAAVMSGAGHLLSFTGTDTIPALDFIDEYYAGDNGMVGGSVPASEHSVASAHWANSNVQVYDESAYIEHMLNLYPTGIFSMVSDTFNLWKVLELCGTKYRERILARDGKVVFRPDSGDPIKIVCGDPDAPEGSPERKGVIRLLDEYFGHTITSTGHKLVNGHVGCIYGDAITYDRGQAICRGLAANGYASTNMVFGVGSFTYTFVTRDTYGFAMKATWAKVNGEGRDLFKKPITDTGEKFSATGRLAVLSDNDGLTVVERATPEQEASSLLEPVWKNGKFLRTQSFADVRRVLWPS